jgi:hypothetical protein
VIVTAVAAASMKASVMGTAGEAQQQQLSRCGQLQWQWLDWLAGKYRLD